METEPLNVKSAGSPSYIFGCSSTVYRMGSRSVGSLTSITGGAVVVVSIVVVISGVTPGAVVIGAAVGHVTTGHAVPVKYRQ